MKMMNLRTTIVAVFMAIAILGTGACSGGNNNQSDGNQNSEIQNNGLSDFEIEHGIGPITEPVSFAEIDSERVEEGRVVFQAKCSACHKMDDRYVGPPLGDVTEKRSAAYIMNMILNPDEMTKKHPVAKELLAEYMAPMAFQNVSEDEARSIVEYLRTESP